MSTRNDSNIPTHSTSRTTAEKRAHRDNVRARNIRRHAAYANELRAALNEAREMFRFDRVLAGA